MPILGLGINPAHEKGDLFPYFPGCERRGMPNVFAIAALYETHRAGRYRLGALLRPTIRKSQPMLFWIAAIGSTWGAYALGFEPLIDVSDRAEAHHGGRQNRTAEHRKRKTDSGS
jgi:hypothetical protein